MTTTDVVAEGRVAETTQAVARIRGLSRMFRRADGTNVRALDDVSLEIGRGQLVVLLGPSGCGKTTLLRSVAGLDEPDSGTIEVLGRTVFDSATGTFLPPERRNLSMIFQSYALWPHMTAYENIAYPLRCRRLRRSEIRDRVSHVLELVGVSALAGQYPSGMSGGQQQRVALARALVGNDQLILFDEPLSNVDAKVREQLRADLLTMQQELGFAALYVTHDQVEAMELADRMAVMDRGAIVQVGTPADVYDRPANPYVARFIGTVNEIKGTVVCTDGRTVDVSTAIGKISAVTDLPVAPSDEVLVMTRPELFAIRDEGDEPKGNCWRGTIVAAMYVGSHTEYVVDVNGIRLRVWQASRDLRARHTTWKFSIAPEHALVLHRNEEQELPAS